jgi:hypothetical protein
LTGNTSLGATFQPTGIDFAMCRPGTCTRPTSTPSSHPASPPGVCTMPLL